MAVAGGTAGFERRRKDALPIREVGIVVRRDVGSAPKLSQGQNPEESFRAGFVEHCVVEIHAGNCHGLLVSGVQLYAEAAC